MVANVLPASCAASPRTFSAKSTRGRISSTARASSKNSVPLVSPNPPCLPAYEKGWHGNPPASRSTFPRRCLKSNPCTSPAFTGQRGLFSCRVLQAIASTSFSSTWVKPAFSSPRANPPAPLNSSTEVYSLTGRVPISSSHPAPIISRISGIDTRVHVGKWVAPSLSATGSYFPFSAHSSAVRLET